MVIDSDILLQLVRLAYPTGLPIPLVAVAMQRDGRFASGDTAGSWVK